jgi:allophanate hydrolase
MAHLRVTAAGLNTTLQDLGRIGQQRLGVTVSGAIDSLSLRAANLIVGNPDGTAAIEALYQGPSLEVAADSVRLALAGAAATLEVRSGTAAPRRVPAFRSLTLVRGDEVRVVLSGPAAAYLAVEGGFAIAPFLGSCSTLVRAHIGGIEGRLLAEGDMLPLARPHAEPRAEQALPALDLSLPPRIRVVLGPQDDYFTAEAIEEFLNGTYTVSRAADRMGLRLDGPELAHAKGFNIVSDGIAPGAIQVPGTRLPIILLADRQTTGGYPKIATVISADLPALGRVGPGQKLAFAAVSVEEAEAERRKLEDEIVAWRSRLEPVKADAPPESSLFEQNLVSGVVDAYALD